MASPGLSNNRFISGITVHTCMALFKREDGFFVGAILANVVTTEVVILAGLLLLPADSRSGLRARARPAVCHMALDFPVAFYHHSWSLWFGFDFYRRIIAKIHREETATTSSTKKHKS